MTNKRLSTPRYPSIIFVKRNEYNELIVHKNLYDVEKGYVAKYELEGVGILRKEISFKNDK